MDTSLVQFLRNLLFKKFEYYVIRKNILQSALLRNRPNGDCQQRRLAVVAKNFSVDVLRELFDKIEQEQKGTSTKIREGNKYSDIDWALWKAAENGNIQNVDFLLEKGASLAAEPIWAAVRSNSAPLVKKFIELGDNIEAKDSNGVTCLALAAIRLEYEIMELLLENNANPNISFKHPTYNYPTSLLSYVKQEIGGRDRVLLLEKYGVIK